MTPSHKQKADGWMITDVKRTASLHVRRADEKVSHTET